MCSLFNLLFRPSVLPFAFPDGLLCARMDKAHPLSAGKCAIFRGLQIHKYILSVRIVMRELSLLCVAGGSAWQRGEGFITTGRNGITL